MADLFTSLLDNLLVLTLDAAPFLLLGLVLSGVLKAWIPERWLSRHLAGSGPLPVVKAAVFGAPLPLCSCGVLPVALNLRRSGASKASTVSFLVATPETGVDSISLSYALLGPVMAIARPIAAIATAISAGLATGWRESGEAPPTARACCGAEREGQASPSVRDGVTYALTRLWDDILGWLLVGLVFAAVVQTLVPPDFLQEWGRGPLAMLVMAAVGVPMYICASASTPIAAGLLAAGISPGTVLVFLLAGPATNIAGIALIRRELGNHAMGAYLGSVVGLSIASGLILDALWQPASVLSAAGQHTLLPATLAWASFAVLALCSVKPLRSWCLARMGAHPA